MIIASAATAPGLIVALNPFNEVNAIVKFAPVQQGLDDLCDAPISAITQRFRA
ncbi:MAG: hypothetical protein H7346_27285 [Burkholderiaceae bacterium]|nr:hypothetical protein [Burkholderiaceae bacterium]